MYLVFVKVLNVNFGVKNSGAYLLIGLVIWGFFTEMTGGSVGSIVGKGDLLRKLNFPRYTIVLAVGISALINLLINMVVVFVFVFIGGNEMHFDALLSPILFAELFTIGMALAFFLSAVYVRLRDIGYVWDVILQAMFYATPIFFPITLAPLWAQKLLILNPIAQCLQDIRYLLVSHDTPTITTIYGNHWMRLVPVGITLFCVVIAAMYFRSRSKYFAEEI
jgi:ABC-2 type transport system permease protein